MKDYIINNTSINEDEYDRIINCDKDLSVNDLSDEYILGHENSLILYNIANFTMGMPTLNNCKKWNVKKIGNTYFHKGVCFRILFDILADKTLFTEDRYGKCHQVSYKIACNSTFDIISLICTDYQSGKDFLHTILFNNKTNEVIDYTLNLIMNKNDYFSLMNARVVKYITNASLKEYNNVISNTTSNIRKNITIRELLCFPEEITSFILRMTKK